MKLNFWPFRRKKATPTPLGLHHPQRPFVMPHVDPPHNTLGGLSDQSNQTKLGHTQGQQAPYGVMRPSSGSLSAPRPEDDDDDLIVPAVDIFSRVVEDIHSTPDDPKFHGFDGGDSGGGGASDDYSSASDSSSSDSSSNSGSSDSSSSSDSGGSDS